MMWGYGFDGWWMWVGGTIVALSIVAGFVVMVVLLARSTGGSGGKTVASSPARETLEMRLANGEITADEFRELMDALESRAGMGR